MTRQHLPSRGALVAQASVCLLLTACMTTTLWGGSIRDHDDDGVSTIRAEGGPEWDGGVWQRILLTPFAVLFDVCTFPVQAALYGWDDDEEEDLEECP